MRTGRKLKHEKNKVGFVIINNSVKKRFFLIPFSILFFLNKKPSPKLGGYCLLILKFDDLAKAGYGVNFDDLADSFECESVNRYSFNSVLDELVSIRTNQDLASLSLTA